MDERNNVRAIVGVREIARRGNVSIATVDRVIHNRSGVSKKTRQWIQQIIEEVNYQPNMLASRLASCKVNRLAVLIPQVSQETDYWAASLTGGVESKQKLASTELRQIPASTT